VFVANAVGSGTPGIYKLNADGSLADEGQGLAGYVWAADGFSGDLPHFLKVLPDDRVLFNDWRSDGKIVACDMIMSTNQVLFDSANLPGAPWVSTLAFGMSDFDVTEPGAANSLLWLGDDRDEPNPGVWVWPLTNNGTADPTFPGIQVLTNGASCDLQVNSGPGLWVDSSANIFIGQQQPNSSTYPSIIAITNWPGALASAGGPICNQNLHWAAGAGDDSTKGLSEIAIDNRINPAYVSAAFSLASGGLRLLNAASGATITNLNQGSAFYLATTWDNVGNVYAGNNNHSWQAFSPPGPNTNTTLAVPTIQLVVPTVITLTNISLSGGTVTIRFISNTSDSPSAFTLLSSSNAAGPYYPASGAVISGGAGAYVVTVPMNGPHQFYRIKLQTTTSPVIMITRMTLSAGNASILFTCTSTNDLPSAFTLLSSSTNSPHSAFAPAAGAFITGGEGQYTATAPTNGPTQFYRVKR
jgi:hypothetical protein